MSSERRIEHTMKTKFSLPILSLSLLFSARYLTCITTNSSNDDELTSNRNNSFRSFSDHINKVSGETMMISGSIGFLTIPGIQPIQTGYTPLYSIDRQSVGNNYLQTYNMVSPQDIEFICLSKHDAAIYSKRFKWYT